MAAATCYSAMTGKEVRYEDVTKAQRNIAKNAVSFGIIYGRGDESLSADLGLTLVQGKKLRAGYFEHYHGVAAYIEAETERLPKVGVAISHFNRHRRLRPAIDDERPGVRNEAIREGINAPIQGDLSDVVWTAGHRLRKWMLKYHFKSKIVIINHDAIIGDIWHKELQDVIEMQYKFMTDREFLRKMTGWYCSVPFDVDFTLGASLANPVELVAKKPGEFIIPPQFN
jgi:DNA polymerase-1